MNRAPPRKDLIVLVADKQTEATIDSLLRHRHRSLAIRTVDFEILVHPRKDPGCLLDAERFLRPFQSRFDRCLVVFDHEGCGQESRDAESLMQDLESKLSGGGWTPDRARSVILQPELEIWVWSDSSEVDRICGWEGREPGLREWLVANGWCDQTVSKPARPKEALRSALREVQQTPSSALFREMAKVVGLNRCNDSAFNKLKSTLRQWFSLDLT